MELFYEGEWGIVDANSGAAARVACRQAGYPYTEDIGFFGQGIGTVRVDILHCTGDEERVEQCYHNGWRDNRLSFFTDWCQMQRCVWCEKDMRAVSRCLTTESDFRLSHHLLYLPIAADKRPSNVSIEATPFSVFIQWMEHSDNIPFVTGYNITMENTVTNAMRMLTVALVRPM